MTCRFMLVCNYEVMSLSPTGMMVASWLIPSAWLHRIKSLPLYEQLQHLVPRGGSKFLDFGWLNACKWETLHINNCRIWSLSERIEGCQANGIGTLGVSSIQHLTLSITVDKSVRQESVPYSFPIFMDLHFGKGIFVKVQRQRQKVWKAKVFLVTCHHIFSIVVDLILLQTHLKVLSTCSTCFSKSPCFSGTS